MKISSNGNVGDNELKEKLVDLFKRWTSIKAFDSPFLELCTIEKIEKGKIVVSMTVTEDHCNLMGTLHGGAIATLIDVISTMAIVSHNLDQVSPGVSVELSVNYASAAPVDRKIYIVSSVYKHGRNLSFSETTIHLDSEDGVIVAKGSHTKFIPVQKKAKL